MLAISIEGLRLCTTHLRPIMPGSCNEILTRLGGSEDITDQLQCELSEDNSTVFSERQLTLDGLPIFTKMK